MVLVSDHAAGEAIDGEYRGGDPGHHVRGHQQLQQNIQQRLRNFVVWLGPEGRYQGGNIGVQCVLDRVQLRESGDNLSCNLGLVS